MDEGIINTALQSPPTCFSELHPGIFIFGYSLPMVHLEAGHNHITSGDSLPLTLPSLPEKRARRTPARNEVGWFIINTVDVVPDERGDFLTC